MPLAGRSNDRIPVRDFFVTAVLKATGGIVSILLPGVLVLALGAACWAAC